MLFRAATRALKEVWQKKGKGIPGIIAVVHTFGGDLKWNPHVHCIVTCGGLDGDRWRWMRYVPYKLLRHSWRYGVVNELRRWGRERFGGKAYTQFNKRLDMLYRKEWYVHVGKRLQSLEFTVKYIGRYAKRPVIAETRLKEFDGETVVFTHKDKVVQQEVEIRLPAEEFIGKLVRHIPEKHHRMIRYSGLFASRVKKEALGLVRAAIGEGCLPMWVPMPVRSWRERMRLFSGTDPYQCSCGRIMQPVALVVRTRSGEMIAIRAPP